MKTSIRIILFVIMCVNTSIATTYTWSGPDEGLWSNPNNWTPNGTPGSNPADEINITGGTSTSQTIIVDASCKAQNIIFTGNTTLKGTLDATNEPAFSIESNLENNGQLDIRSIELIGQVTNKPTSVLKLREIRCSAYIHNIGGELTWYMTNILDDLSSISNSGKMNIRNPGVVVSYGPMTNTGIIFVENANLAFYDGATLTNEGTLSGSGYIIVEDTPLSNSGAIKSFLDDLTISSLGEFINEGQIYNEPGTLLTISLGGSFQLQNQGQIETFSGGGVRIFGNNVVNNENGLIQLNGGFLKANVQTDALSTFQGRGELIGSLDIRPNAIANFHKTLTVLYNFYIQPSAEVTFEDAEVLVEGSISNEGIIHLKSSRLIPRGGLYGAGQIDWGTSDYNTVTDYNFDGTVNFEDIAIFSQTWLWQSPL